MYAINLVGKKFTHLLVQKRGENKGKEPCWLCLCDCGSITTVRGSGLRSGSTKSCGCLARNVTKNRSITHGKFGTAEWRAWAAMKSRCYLQTNKSYSSYGGRGISVCEEWLDSFEAFFADMGVRPSAHHQLDRINNNGNYERSNCRWATRKVNINNRRVTVRYNGLTLRELAEKSGENYATLKTRARRAKWQRD